MRAGACSPACFRVRAGELRQARWHFGWRAGVFRQADSRWRAGWRRQADNRWRAGWRRPRLAGSSRRVVLALPSVADWLPSSTIATTSLGVRRDRCNVAQTEEHGAHVAPVRPNARIGRARRPQAVVLPGAQHQGSPGPETRGEARLLRGSRRFSAASPVKPRVSAGTRSESGATAATPSPAWARPARSSAWRSGTIPADGSASPTSASTLLWRVSSDAVGSQPDTGGWPGFCVFYRPLEPVDAATISRPLHGTGSTLCGPRRTSAADARRDNAVADQRTLDDSRVDTLPKIRWPRRADRGDYPITDPCGGRSPANPVALGTVREQPNLLSADRNSRVMASAGRPPTALLLATSKDVGGRSAPAMTREL